MDEITLLLSKVHAEFRKLRNGEVGDNLRAQGIDYKTIWGLESYRLKGIAELLLPEIETQEMQAALAERLWEEEVRESKMLATRLYPKELMTEPVAQQWASAIRYTELADQACMNLFARLPFAEALVSKWMEGNDLLQYMALQIILRLELSGWQERAAQLAQDTHRPMWLRVAAQRILSE